MVNKRKTLIILLYSLRSCRYQGELFIYIKGQQQCKFFRKSAFLSLKFNLNFLEYEAKGFIHETISFLFNFAFFLRRVGRLSYGYLRYEHTFSEGTQGNQLKTLNALFSKHIFSKRHAP